MGSFNQHEVLAVGENLMVIDKKDAITFRPIIMRGTDSFDPANGFKPIHPKPRQKMLGSQFHKEAQRLIQEASDRFAKMLKEREMGNAPTVPVETSDTPTPVPTGAFSKFESLIADSIAQIASETVIEQIKPHIQAFIEKEYGVLPKVVEVRTAAKNVKLEGLTHNKFETVLQLVSNDIPVFLSGAAGTGKNVICQQVAQSLDLEFYFSNAVTQEYKLTGFIDGNGHYHETQFYKSFTQGGIFMLDEIDASTPEVLVILNAAIANRYFDFPTGKFMAHPDFRIVAAGNTYGTGADMEYTGRYQLDAASLDRFAIVEVGYDKDIEYALSGNNKDIIAFIGDFRDSLKQTCLKFTVSYRSIERLKTLCEVFDTKEALRLALLRSLAYDDIKMIAKNMEGTTALHHALAQIAGI